MNIKSVKNKLSVGFLTVVSICLIACQGPANNNKTETIVADSLVNKPVKIGNGLTKNVTCFSDSLISYDLFVPSQHGNGKALPVVFIFDPHAKGYDPVMLYKEIAESFGYVLVASNNSRNGQDMHFANKIYQQMLGDVSQRLSVDMRRIYTMGFSGGSRVASSLALSNEGIAGVIGCSAGFSKNALQGPISFNYIGIVGNEDFNYTEMKALDLALNETAVRHQLLVFDGSHNWCPAEIMKIAFYWITFNAIRSQIIQSDGSLYNQFLTEMDEREKHLSGIGSGYELFIHDAMVVNFLDGLYDVSVYKEKLNQLLNSDKMRGYESYLNRIASEESRVQQQYQGFIDEREPAWWQAEVENLKTAIRKKDQRPAESQFKKRLLNYTSLLAYTFSNQALASNELDKAAKYLSIYAIVDPENSEHAYMKAILMMKYNLPDKAVSALREAIELGFSDRERLMKQPEFEVLQTNNVFNSLLPDNK